MRTSVQKMCFLEARGEKKTSEDMGDVIGLARCISLKTRWGKERAGLFDRIGQLWVALEASGVGGAWKKKAMM